jgi:hypothetical protein
METIICPKCGTGNPANAMNCRHCRVNLKFALEHADEVERSKQEAIQTAGEETGLPVGAAVEEISRGCWTAFLILAVIGNPIAALLQWGMARDGRADLAPLAVIGGVLNLAGLIFVIGIGKWKKWGVYGYVSCIGLFMLLNLMRGQVLAAIQAALPIALLIGLAQPVWKHFK